MGRPWAPHTWEDGGLLPAPPPDRPDPALGVDGGVVVTVGSSAAPDAASIGAAYGASKAGVEVMTRYWAGAFGGSARGKAGDPEEVADIVAFLASGYVNGAVLFAAGRENSPLPA